MSTRLRSMREEDIRRILPIERACFPTPWSRRMFEDEFGHGEDRYWVVADSPWGLLGYGGVMIAGDEGHVLNLAVRHDARGRGLGTALLSDLVVAARERGVRRLTLEVRPSNERAIRLYEAAGFAGVGHRPGYYVDSGEDALIMWTGDMAAADAVARASELRERSGTALDSLRLPDSAREGAAVDRGDLILAIETSCDETAASVVRNGLEVLSSVVASQIDFHRRFGGVVPEIASRKHVEAIVGVVDEALEEAGVTLEDLTALAVTQGPGLVGALVVGVAYAKGLSFATGLPLVGVNHLEGHLFANLLADPDLSPPLVALIVSGGHTSLVHVPAWGEYRTLGATLDDAAGEAFDKVAKALGLGYPGGPVLSTLAAEGDPTAIRFPRAMMHSGTFDFSLSGLKTAVVTHLETEREAGRDVDPRNLAASFQAAVIDVQVAKSVRAARECGVDTFCLAGGVSANAALREALRISLAAEGVRLSVPPLDLCTDNAAMIAAAGHFRFRRGETIGPAAEAVPNMRLD